MSRLCRNGAQVGQNFIKDNSVSTKFNKATWAKQQNKEAVQAMKELIKKIETGQFYVENYGGWPGVEGKYNFNITLKSAEIPVLSEELEKKS